MNYYNEIKNELINNEINRKVKKYAINKSDLDTYYKVGKILSEAGKHYGEGVIKQYSIRLTSELGKGYTETNLKYFRQFYLFLKSHTLCDELSWSHYRILLSIDDDNEIDYYVLICRQQNLSVRKLQERIKSNEFKRLPSNTRNKIINKINSNVVDFVKNPIIIKNNNDYEVISEKILQRLILENIETFLEELGNGFTFIKSEYPIKLGKRYNYIDLLLFNIEYNCYVVVELKVTELRKEHIGQIQVYMNYVDENLRKNNQDKTIGLIICKQDNKYVIKYCSDDKIISREYKLV
ncbi:MAG: DUF1016 domain-containing protein [Firmicutes bacterium]|nr:DUF1016 domain-containing protein [Bacillota bacterium]